MSGDHFDEFRRGLQAAKAAAPPTKDMLFKDFQEKFPQIVAAIQKMNSILEEEQPHYAVSYSSPRADLDTRMIWITIRGSKGRVASVIEFRVQGDVLTSLTSVFNNKQGGKSQWTSAEEADLVPRMTRFFMEYFAEK